MVDQQWDGVSQSGVNVVFVDDIEAIGHVSTDNLTLVINDASVSEMNPSATDVVHSVNCCRKAKELVLTNVVLKELSSSVSDTKRSHHVVTAEEVQSEHGWLVGESGWLVSWVGQSS
jgi:hypothetical protein